MEKWKVTVTRRTESERPLIPPSLRDAYGSVEAAITAQLAVYASQTVGEMPFTYGEMGGKNSPRDALEQLKRGRVGDRKIARVYLKNQGITEIRDDPDMLARVLSAINSIRGTIPVNN
jgi:hypothetical protein